MILAMLAAAATASSPAPVVQGRAVVECRVTATGLLRDCVALSETPANANVGAFAVKLATGFHVQPNDRRIVAGHIRVPMQFKMPGSN